MTNIMLACPYNGLRSVTESLKRYSDSTRVIDCYELSHVTMQSLCLSTGEQLPLSSIDCAFIRYPYDLIPPHTESFRKREETEFLKTLALLLEGTSPNRITTSWSIRNRIFSMNLARGFGVPVPAHSEIVRSCTTLGLQDHEHAICKALGNCFFSWSSYDIPTECRDCFSIEEDDGESAVIMPAQRVPDAARNLLEECGLVFTQSLIGCSAELRAYLVGDSFFVYQRKLLDGLDQSAAECLRTDLALPSDLTVALLSFQHSIGLMYCCYDIIMDDKLSPTVIDINPFGSLPSYESHPEVADTLSDYIVEYGRKNAQQRHTEI